MFGSVVSYVVGNFYKRYDLSIQYIVIINNILLVASLLSLQARLVRMPSASRP